MSVKNNTVMIHGADWKHPHSREDGVSVVTEEMVRQIDEWRYRQVLREEKEKGERKEREEGESLCVIDEGLIATTAVKNLGQKCKAVGKILMGETRHDVGNQTFRTTTTIGISDAP
ncbi:hypothetical protein QOT17_010618 [Balamuthia mandrillaris]